MLGEFLHSSKSSTTPLAEHALKQKTDDAHSAKLDLTHHVRFRDYRKGAQGLGFRVKLRVWLWFGFSGLGCRGRAFNKEAPKGCRTERKTRKVTEANEDGLHAGLSCGCKRFFLGGFRRLGVFTSPFLTSENEGTLFWGP